MIHTLWAQIQNVSVGWISLSFSIQQSAISSGLPRKNQFHFQGNVVKVSHI
jgi:hypothetical protein